MSNVECASLVAMRSLRFKQTVFAVLVLGPPHDSLPLGPITFVEALSDTVILADFL